MAKDLDYIEKERDSWGKVFTDISYAISEISPFLDEEQFKKRRYYIKVSVLKEYMELINSIEFDSKKKSLFNSFKSDDRIKKLEDYKSINLPSFTQLKNCSRCQCLNCVFECSFRGCSSCKQGSFIKTCDKERINVRYYDNFIIDLTNNDTGESSKYKTLATIEDCESDNLYIALQNMYDMNDKLILHYYPGIKEDTYGEITDGEEFDFVVQAYQESDY